MDFQSAQELLAEELDDPDVLQIAAGEGRIVVSHDVSTMRHHFQRFLAGGGQSPGLFLIPQSIPVSAAIEELILIWPASDDSDWRNRNVWLPL